MNATLQLLAGDEVQFARGLVDLGWFDYPPTLTNEPLMAATRRSLNPHLRSAGEVTGAGASVYRLTLDSHRWQDAVKVVESQLNRRPHFAVVFVTLPCAVMIVVPEDPDRARSEKPGIRTAQIFLDTTRDDKHADEVIKRLRAAKKEGFRKKLQESADIKRVTDGFYKAFDKQKDAFIGFIEEVGSLENKQWYASVLLNRLMFIYFIQSNGLMEQGYLRTHLELSMNTSAANTVSSTNTAQRTPNYYRDFLCALFFDGLAVEQNKRAEAVKTLLGDVPYLNGGLFMPHKLENEHQGIVIADEAFHGLFKLFDEYTWYIDDRPIARDRELNPDVLGYIFEKYVNQKQMGAYYTKEDITGYICRNTIIPRLFDVLAEARCLEEFRLPIKEIEPYIWDAVKYGVNEPLPDYIEVGVAEVSLRTRWNETAPASHALPTETWRELNARRQRHAEIHRDFAAGKITTANDFITYNLNLPLAALDFIHQCTDAAILSDLYFKCLQRITVLDPTCGSGAFLFAALNILYPLYEACLDRMEELKLADRVEDRPLLTMKGEFDFANEVDAQQTFMDPDFDLNTVTTAILERCQDELDRIADQRHPNRSYYIHKTIIVNNLYGVDIMEEAVEICKLRLFLNLISHADPDKSKENLGIEPLPDIDFNILAGNTLVGYTSIADIDRQWHAVEVEKSTLAFEKDHSKLGMLLTEYGHKVELFRKQQLGEELNMPIQTKQDVHRACALVQPGLDEDLWRLYRTAGKLPEKTTLKRFTASHQPFHWILQFPQVMAGGGFDVVVGNPPYVEYSKIRESWQVLGYGSEKAGNLYAFVSERALELRAKGAWCGLVLQQPIVSTLRMAVVRDIFVSDSNIVLSSTYDDRPSKLFEGMHHARIAILLAQRVHERANCKLYVTHYNKWYRDERDVLFARIRYILAESKEFVGCFPKIATETETAIIHSLTQLDSTLSSWISAQPTDHRVYYKITGVGHWFTITLRPPRFMREEVESSSTREQSISFPDPEAMCRAFAVLNSSLFYWFYQVRTNCRDFNPSDFRTFPIAQSATDEDMADLAHRLQTALDDSSRIGNENNSITGSISVERFRPREAKPIIDEIDRVLAKHYGLTGEQLDFIVNYDIKYRMGKGTEEEDT